MRKKVPTVFILFTAAIISTIGLLFLVPQSMKENKIEVRTLKGEERHLSGIAIEREIALAQNSILRETIPIDSISQSSIRYHTDRPLNHILLYRNGYWGVDFDAILEDFHDNTNQDLEKNTTLADITDWYPLTLLVFGKNTLINQTLSGEEACYLHIDLKEEDAKQIISYDFPESMNERFTSRKERLEGKVDFIEDKDTIYFTLVNDRLENYRYEGRSGIFKKERGKDIVVLHPVSISSSRDLEIVRLYNLSEDFLGLLTKENGQYKLSLYHKNEDRISSVISLEGEKREKRFTIVREENQLIFVAESTQDEKIEKEYYVYDGITGNNPSCIFYAKTLNDGSYVSVYDEDRDKFDLMYQNGYLYELRACYLFEKEKPTTLITVVGTEGVEYVGGVFGSESSDMELVKSNEGSMSIRSIEKVRFIKKGEEG